MIELGAKLQHRNEFSIVDPDLFGAGPVRNRTCSDLHRYVSFSWILKRKDPDPTKKNLK